MDAATRFRALFQTHHAAVRRYAFHRAIQGADADDLVAEVFTVAWRRLDHVPTDDALPWLLAVAGNVRRNQARSARRYESALVALPRPESVPPPREPDDRAAILHRALSGLSADDQEILRLVAWDGLTPKQIAVALGCPDGTVRARLHRARRRLAERLAELQSEADPRPRQHPPGPGQFVGESTHTEEDNHEQVN
jgi:RNA polymerase sigma-70 factor (ECF subfamily)